MSCYHPMPAQRMADGSVKFVSKSKGDGTLYLPCGQCIGCRLERARQWAVRCVHESSLHSANSFITLTYNDANLPCDGSLHYEDFQKFMKRLRKYAKVPVRFYCGGEYGPLNWRPHYHACLFGYDFMDKLPFSRRDGVVLYRSALLDRLWGLGFTTVGSVTFESAGYIARYCVQKVTGDLAAQHYRWTNEETGEVFDRVPEFNHMSLKPGIGANWLRQFKSDVYPRDFVVINGVRSRPPGYYDALLERDNPDLLDELKAQRELDAVQWAADNSYARLAVKETVHKARTNFLKRTL